MEGKPERIRPTTACQGVRNIASRPKEGKAMPLRSLGCPEADPGPKSHICLHLCRADNVIELQT